MDTSIFIARIFGLCYLIIATGFIFNLKFFQRVMQDFCKNAALLFYGGIMALVIGLAIVLNHNVWVADWRVIITLLGWAGLIKGIWIIVFPNSVDKFMQVYQRNQNLLVVHAIVALAFGVVLTFFGYFGK